MGGRFSFPRHLNGLPGKAIEVPDSVDPSFNSCGGGILFFLICYIYQQPSTSIDARIALFSLTCNLICFATSSLCHSKSLKSTTNDPHLYFRLDHIGIILHIWSSSIAVLFLEVKNSKSGFIVLVITLVGVVSAVCLLLPSIGKRERILVIGGFGAFTFLSALTYIVLHSNPSRVAVSYITMVIINSVGGWSYYRGSYTFTQKDTTLKGLCYLRTLIHAYMLSLCIYISCCGACS